jgi:hypothetical protein
VAIEKSDPLGPDRGPTRVDLRQDWALKPSAKRQLLQNLTEFLDPASNRGERCQDQPWIEIAAARAIAPYCKLALEQQKLDLKAAGAWEDDCRDVLLSQTEAIVRSHRPDAL